VVKKHFWLVIIFLIALLLRFILLDKVPIGITGDELDYVLNSKAIALSGSDISGTWSPFSLKPPPYEVPKGEILYLVMAPFIGILDFSLFTARLPYTLASSLFPVVIYLIVNKLIGKKEAIIAGLLMAINPWSIFFGRTAYDTPVTIFFYFVALYFLLVTKKWKILFSFLFFFIAFFGYIGTKVIFIPFVAMSIFFVYKYINKQQFLKQYLVLFFLCSIVFAYFLTNLLSTSSPTRTGELISPNHPSINNSVILERQLTITNPANSIFSNKYVELVRDAFTNYISAFSPAMLFAYGEQTAFISLNDQGFFYYIDFIFLFLGFCVLFSRNKKAWIFLTALALIAPIPSALSTSGVSHGIRSSLLIPLIIIFASVGISFVMENRKYRIVSVGILLIAYTSLLFYFLHNYMFRQPIYASDTFNFSGRLISKYIDLAERNKKKIIFIVKENELISTYFFKQYLFYSNSYNKNTYKEISEIVNTKKSAYKHILAVRCSEYTDSENSITIVESGTCNNLNLPKNKLSISRLADGGEIYSVFDTLICKKYFLKRYPSNISLADLDVEKMSEERFCTTYITELL